jgi:MFS family permease
MNKKLFNASCFALITTAMTFAVRAKIELVFREDYGLTLGEIGIAFGPAFYGFTLAMIIGGFMVDLFGMKKIMNIAFITHLVGIILTLFARDFTLLFLGTLLIGIGNGMVEAACNPLIATLYPNEKTKMLNRFHVWFPGGIVIGSVLGFLIVDIMGLSWMVLVGTLFIPLAIYVYLFAGQKFPPTDRVTSGVTYNEMLKASFANPLFWFIGFCMLLTASTELATTQRISSLLEKTVSNPILVLAFINGIMMVGRLFAGDVVHKLSITKMLLFSSIFSFLGLLWLSSATGASSFLAAGVFAIGVCYFWPTMLSFVAEKIPDSGALGLSLMGGLGMFSVSIVLWVMGSMMDLDASGADTLYTLSILPVILIVLFGIRALYENKQAKAA